MEVDDSALLHGKPYDPVKAHEYYVRHRHLKGRHPGQQPPTGHKKRRRTPPAKLRKQRKEIESRVSQLNDRLTKLNAVLDAELKRVQAQTKLNAHRGKSPAQIQKIAKGESPATAVVNLTSGNGTKAPLTPDQQQQQTLLAAQQKVDKIRKDLQGAIETARKHAEEQLGHPSQQSDKKPDNSKDKKSNDKSKTKTDPNAGRRH